MIGVGIDMEIKISKKYMTKLPLPLNQLNIYKTKNVKYLYYQSFKQLLL